MELLPAGGGRIPSPEPEAGPADVAEEAVPEVPRAPSSPGTPSAGLPRGPGDSWAGEEDAEDAEPGEPRGGRTSRTASLVSGLLTELYSCTEEEEAPGGGRGPGGRQRRSDSLDSSTEASGSDVVLGGRGGAGDSRVLQELQERPSQRHQRQYLRQKGERGGQPAPPCAPRPEGPARGPREGSDLSPLRSAAGPGLDVLSLPLTPSPSGRREHRCWSPSGGLPPPRVCVEARWGDAVRVPIPPGQLFRRVWSFWCV